jgi:hypothetical protein
VEEAILLKMSELQGTKFRENKAYLEPHRHDDKIEAGPQIGYFQRHKYY